MLGKFIKSRTEIFSFIFEYKSAAAAAFGTTVTVREVLLDCFESIVPPFASLISIDINKPLSYSLKTNECRMTNCSEWMKQWGRHIHYWFYTEALSDLKRHDGETLLSASKEAEEECRITSLFDAGYFFGRLNRKFNAIRV